MAGYSYIMGNGRIATEHGQKALRSYNIAEKKAVDRLIEYVLSGSFK